MARTKLIFISKNLFNGLNIIRNKYQLNNKRKTYSSTIQMLLDIEGLYGPQTKIDALDLKEKIRKELESIPPDPPKQAPPKNNTPIKKATSPPPKPSRLQKKKWKQERKRGKTEI